MTELVDSIKNKMENKNQETEFQEITEIDRQSEADS